MDLGDGLRWTVDKTDRALHGRIRTMDHKNIDRQTEVGNNLQVEEVVPWRPVVLTLAVRERGLPGLGIGRGQGRPRTANF